MSINLNQNRLFCPPIKNNTNTSQDVVDGPTISGYVEFVKKEKLNINHNFSFNDNSHPSQELHAIFSVKIAQFIAEKFSKPAL